MSVRALQIAEERREAKGRGERERYIKLNAEFQRIAGRDKKALLNEECKEIEENNRMGKTRESSRKWIYQGNISCKDGYDKGHEMVRTQQKKQLRSGRSIQNSTRKVLMTLDIHDRVITHLEPHILQCEIKWAFGSITANKASGGARILVDLFKILKDEVIKVKLLIFQQIGKTQQWLQDSVQFSHSVVSDFLRPHGLQHARAPCPSPSPGIYSNSCP